MTSMPRIRDEIAYGYAVGRVRVLEGRLLTRVTFERLIDAADLREQKRVLAETHVGRYLEGAETAVDIERALAASIAELYAEFLERAGLPAAVVTYFQAPHDFANLRLAVKSRVLGMSTTGQFSVLGSVPAEEFAADGAGLPDEMRGLFTVFDGAEEPPDLDEVEALVDRAMFDALVAAARASRVPFLRELTTLRIDLANARLLVRARAKRLSSPQVGSRLVPGGSKKLAALAGEASRMSAAELADAIISTGVLPGIAEADLVDVGRFDLAADAVVARRMKAAGRAPGGAEPVLAYVLAREAEVLQLRTALVGRLAGLDSETIRARVKERAL